MKTDNEVIQEFGLAIDQARDVLRQSSEVVVAAQKKQQDLMIIVARLEAQRDSYLLNAGLGDHLATLFAALVGPKVQA